LRFNESVWIRTTDQSGNGNHGYLLNTEAGDWVAGTQGTGVRLDSVDESVEVRSSASWATRLDSFTVSAWVKIDELAGSNYKSIFTVGSWQDRRLSVYPVNGRLSFEAKSEDWSTSVSTTPQSFLQSSDGQFHHIVAVKDAASHSASLYVDGNLVGTDGYASGAVDLRGWDFSFCGASDGGQQLACTIDNVSMYHRALSEADIGQVYRGQSPSVSTPSPSPSPSPTPTTSGAVVDIVFAEGSGGTSLDRSGRGNNAVLLNTENADWVGGQSGYAIKLDGTNERVHIPSSASWAGQPSNLTVAAWVKFDQLIGTNYKSIISVGSWADQRLNLYHVNGSLHFAGDTSGWDVHATGSWQSFLWQPDDQFHHIVAVKDEATRTASIYVDGTLIGTDEYASGSLNLGSWDLSFCANSVGKQAMPCELDSASMYHRALGNGEISQLYQNGRSGQVSGATLSSTAPTPTSSGTVPSGAVLDLRFNEGSGTTSSDSSGQGNHAQLVRTENSNWVSSGSSNAVRLNGDNESIKVAQSSSVNAVHSDMALSMWVRFDQLAGSDYKSVASVGSWGDQRLNIYPIDGRLHLSAATWGRSSSIVSSTLSFLQNAEGRFHHIVIAKNSAQSNLSLYVDGQLVGQNQFASGNIDFRGWELTFGANSKGEHLLPMTLDSAMFYKRGLGQAEVTQLYNAGAR